MKRKAHIEFTGKTTVTITTLFRQRHFDLSELTRDQVIDLVGVRIVDNVEQVEQWDSGFVLLSMGGYYFVSAKQAADKSWSTIGNFEFGKFYTSNGGVDEAKEYTYEVTLFED